MRRVLVGSIVSLVFASMADAKCVGSKHSIRLGTEVSIHRETDGAACFHKVLNSGDPIYGVWVRSQPKHGSLIVASRLTLVYRPSAGFKGEVAPVV